MRKLFVFTLLAVLTIGTSIGFYVGSMSGSSTNDVQTKLSATSFNIIDHLPFVINETGVYFIAQDLTVSGNGITVLANDTVLIGQCHTITGDGSGNGINVTANEVTVADVEVKNFYRGIVITGNTNLVTRCKVSGNRFGIQVRGYGEWNRVKKNIIINNTWGLHFQAPRYTSVYDNYIANNTQNVFDENSIGDDYFNTTKTLEENIISGPYLGGNYWDDYSGEDTDGDGIGEDYYLIPCNSVDPQATCSKDYSPLVDNSSPYYGPVGVSLNYASKNTALFSITWTDNARVDTVILELDGTNYTDLIKVDESLGFSGYHKVKYGSHQFNLWTIPVQYKATYNRIINLPFGTHTYRWFANDTSGNWNSTELLSFNFTGVPQINSVEISPTLEVTANITCEGVNNITEVLKFVDLNFKIDDQWYMMSMSYNVETGLYSALIPAYNQLANKTILVYVTAMDVNNHLIGSDVYIYHVPEWVKADLNRDGKVDWKDWNIFFKYYYSPTGGGETSPTPSFKLK